MIAICEGGINRMDGNTIKLKTASEQEAVGPTDRERCPACNVTFSFTRGLCGRSVKVTATLPNIEPGGEDHSLSRTLNLGAPNLEASALGFSRGVKVNISREAGCDSEGLAEWVINTSRSIMDQRRE